MELKYPLKSLYTLKTSLYFKWRMIISIDSLGILIYKVLFLSDFRLLVTNSFILLYITKCNHVNLIETDCHIYDNLHIIYTLALLKKLVINKLW